MPQFDTIAGSAVTDRVSFTGRANYRWNTAWAGDSGYRVQYNKLDKSETDKRTVLHVPTAALSWTPESSGWMLRDFFSRLFWEQRRRFSEDDPSGQGDFISNEIGIEDEFKIRKYKCAG